MKIYRTTKGIVLENEKQYFQLSQRDWNIFINRDDLYAQLQAEVSALKPDKMAEDWLQSETLAPVDRQEVWAAGVTYLRSRDARMDESKESGGATFYDKVYEAERPELFFKATGHRVVGPGKAVRIRKDSTWNVPEPELALFVSSSGKILGYTIGNDMSSRSIEGENPLYLPQAKVYDGSAALGPCLFVPEKPIDPSTKIQIQISRGSNLMYSGEALISQMKRSHSELVDYLCREYSFPDGCFLMTGTCLVPPHDFTLAAGDVITISIDGIGTLENFVA